MLAMIYFTSTSSWAIRRVRRCLSFSTLHTSPSRRRRSSFCCCNLLHCSRSSCTSSSGAGWGGPEQLLGCCTAPVSAAVLATFGLWPSLCLPPSSSSSSRRLPSLGTSAGPGWAMGRDSCCCWRLPCNGLRAAGACFGPAAAGAVETETAPAEGGSIGCGGGSWRGATAATMGEQRDRSQHRALAARPSPHTRTNVLTGFSTLRGATITPTVCWAGAEE